MALFQIDGPDGKAHDDFDDGLSAYPGEEGFTTELVLKHAEQFGKGTTVTYKGTPNWHIARENEDRNRAAIEATKAAQKEKDTSLQDYERQRQVVMTPLSPEPLISTPVRKINYAPALMVVALLVDIALHFFK